MSSREVRVGDAEREAAARRLRDHCAAGRLSVEELDDRLGVVYRARTRGELDRLMVDLPPAPDPPRSGLRPRRIFWPGVAAFHEERHLNAPCTVSYAAAMRQIVPRLGLHGYRLVDDIEPRRLQFMTHAGLDVTVIFRPAADGGTNVSAFGQAPRDIRKAFATMAD